MTRKSLFLFIVLLGSVFLVNAQTFKPKTFAINVDVGLINTFGWGKVKVPPITASLDYGLFCAGPGTISGGVLLGYARSFDKHKFTWSTTAYYNYTYDYYMAAFRGAYHLCPGYNDQIDVYAGFIAGYDIIRGEFKTDYPFTGYPPAAEVSHFLGGVFVGGRFFFIPNLGVNVELGYGISVVNIGASVKF